MKDSNDARTIDWVDEFLDEYPQAVAQTQLQLDDMFNSGLVISPTVSPEWHKVITKLTEQTLNDIENQQEQ